MEDAQTKCMFCKKENPNMISFESFDVYTIDDLFEKCKELDEMDCFNKILGSECIFKVIRDKICIFCLMGYSGCVLENISKMLIGCHKAYLMYSFFYKKMISNFNIEFSKIKEPTIQCVVCSEMFQTAECIFDGKYGLRSCSVCSCGIDHCSCACCYKCLYKFSYGFMHTFSNHYQHCPKGDCIQNVLDAYECEIKRMTEPVCCIKPAKR